MFSQARLPINDLTRCVQPPRCVGDRRTNVTPFATGPSVSELTPTPPGEDGSRQPGERPAYIAVAFFGLYFLAGFIGHVVGLL